MDDLAEVLPRNSSVTFILPEAPASVPKLPNGCKLNVLVCKDQASHKVGGCRAFVLCGLCVLRVCCVCAVCAASVR